MAQAKGSMTSDRIRFASPLLRADKEIALTALRTASSISDSALKIQALSIINRCLTKELQEEYEVLYLTWKYLPMTSLPNQVTDNREQMLSFIQLKPSYFSLASAGVSSEIKARIDGAGLNYS